MITAPCNKCGRQWTGTPEPRGTVTCDRCAPCPYLLTTWDDHPNPIPHYGRYHSPQAAAEIAYTRNAKYWRLEPAHAACPDNCPPWVIEREADIRERRAQRREVSQMRRQP